MINSNDKKLTNDQIKLVLDVQSWPRKSNLACRLLILVKQGPAPL